MEESGGEENHGVFGVNDRKRDQMRDGNFVSISWSEEVTSLYLIISTGGMEMRVKKHSALMDPSNYSTVSNPNIPSFWQ